MTSVLQPIGYRPPLFTVLVVLTLLLRTHLVWSCTPEFVVSEADLGGFFMTLLACVIQCFFTNSAG